MSKRKKKWTLTAIVVVLCVIVFILMDVFAFSTVKIADEKYVHNEIAYVRKEPYVLWARGELRGLDDAKGEMGFDVRSMDLVRFTLTGQDDLLEEVVYDSYTKWPEDLPDGFDPAEILELGKYPGLGIRQLHDMGYTGEGVSIAIIDQGLNPEHKEYAEHLMGYELYHQLGEGASMHGSAVTSIAVGQSCGVAPGADLYYIASSFGRITPIGVKPDTNIVADAIYRVLEINELLPNEKKIRVISISKGFKGTLGGLLLLDVFNFRHISSSDCTGGKRNYGYANKSRQHSDHSAKGSYRINITIAHSSKAYSSPINSFEKIFK